MLVIYEHNLDNERIVLFNHQQIEIGMKKETKNKKEDNLIFAFDVGTGSLGFAVRRGNEMLESGSFTLAPEYGKKEEQRNIIRAYRTRLAHQERVNSLKRVCSEVDIPVLESRYDAKKGDERLEREFPKEGDKTVYNSALLRIMLLRGDKMEPWQVYKALYSAIQRRGFDSQVPWKNKQSTEEGEADSKTAKRATEYERDLLGAVGDNLNYQYPCYYAALRMGLWDPKTNKIQNRPTHHARGVRNYVIPRKYVEKELEALLEAAAKRFPRLKGRAMQVVYGPAGKAYASYYPQARQKYNLKEGASSDWNGVLGQKIPRFDNRHPSQCVLIPRFNVARSADNVIYESTFLIKLKNIRVYRDGMSESMLNVDEIKELLEMARKKNVEHKRENSTKTKRELTASMTANYAINKTTWKKWLKAKGCSPILTQAEIEAPSANGRSTLSRIGARIMCKVILSGEDPQDFYQDLLPLCGEKGTLCEHLQPDDLKFLTLMKGGWEKIQIPIMPLVGNWSGKLAAEKIDERIKKLLGEQRNAVVVHRIGLFDKEFRRLKKTYGTPDDVVIEFVREDFLGEEAKKKFILLQNENKKEWDATRNQANEHRVTGSANIRRLRLLREQGFICPYTGEILSINQVNELQIEHVVPRAQGGSDNRYNLVVTTARSNNEKGDRTPYEWLRGKGAFAAYCDRVDKMNFSEKKKRFLTSEDPKPLDKKWDSLAETAYIARLARDIVAIRCGWQPGEKGECQHIHIINGALTAKVRALDHLNSLLSITNEGETPDKVMKKVRKNPKHHALDAMVLSFIPEWARNPELQKHYKLPSGIDRQYFEDCLEKVVPYTRILSKAKLQETIYGKRKIVDDKGNIKEKMTIRKSLAELGVEKRKFNQTKACKEAKNIIDLIIKEAVVNALKDSEFTPEEWEKWCKNFVHPKTGSAVFKVRIIAQKDDAKEYVNVAKEGNNPAFRGQYKLGDQHQGYYIYLEKDKKGKEIPKVWPVYVWQSLKKEAEKLNAKGYSIVGFFQTGCLVDLKKEYHHKEYIVPPGKYTLKTVLADGRFKLENVANEKPLPLNKIEDILHSFRRIKQ